MTNTKKTKVFITSYLEEQAQQVAERIRFLHSISDKRFLLTEDSELADMILIGSIGNEVNDLPYLNKILCNNIIDKYPNKCFSVSFRDKPITFNRGIYESTINNFLSYGRVKTAAYNSSGFNSYIREHIHSNKDYEIKKYLFSFIGRQSHPIRQQIFTLNISNPNILIEDSSTFDFWQCTDETEKDNRQKWYYDALIKSKFSLCPRGHGTGSIRLFESMMLGICPIIISDDWVLPSGPNWSEFSIIISEKDTINLEKIVISYESRYIEMGKLARQAYQKFFSDEIYFNYIVDNCADIQKNQFIPESIYWNLRYIIKAILFPKSNYYLQTPIYYISKVKQRIKHKIFNRSTS